MTIDAKPDTDTLEALDFQPSCDCRIPLILPECGKPAAWVLIKQCGHTSFACDACKAKGSPSATWVCLRCRHEGTVEFRPL